MDRLSIIIPVYNQELFIVECLKSVFAQTRVPDEVIVVDDRSTDESFYRVIEMTDDHPDNMSVIRHKENMGVSVARNDGLRKSTGDYIVLLDGDDMLTPRSIEKRLKYLQKHPKTDVVYGQARKCHGDVSYRWCLKHHKQLQRYVRPKQFRAFNFQTVMYRRRVFERYGLFFEGLLSAEDKEFRVRLGLHRTSPWKPKVRAAEIKADVVYYRRHPGSKHKRRIKDARWKAETDRILKKRIKQLVNEGITKENTPFL